MFLFLQKQLKAGRPTPPCGASLINQDPYIRYFAPIDLFIKLNNQIKAAQNNTVVHMCFYLWLSGSSKEPLCFSHKCACVQRPSYHSDLVKDDKNPSMDHLLITCKTTLMKSTILSNTLQNRKLKFWESLRMGHFM